MWTGAVCIICVLIVMGTMATYVALTSYLNRKHAGYGYFISVANAVTIIVYNNIYGMIADCLVCWENHRTETEFQDSLIIKIFLFQFVNSYFSLYLTAFIKPYSLPSHPAGLNGTAFADSAARPSSLQYEYFGTCSCSSYSPANCYNATVCVDTSCSNLPYEQCHCSDFDCQGDVGHLLLTLFLVQLTWGNISEVLMPQLIGWLCRTNRDRDDEKSDAEKALLFPSSAPDLPLCCLFCHLALCCTVTLGTEANVMKMPRSRLG